MFAENVFLCLTNEWEEVREHDIDVNVVFCFLKESANSAGGPL